MKNLIPTLASALTITLFLLSGLQAEEANQPKLFEPYNPKPSGSPPEGWEIKILNGSQVENNTVLSNKREIKVTVPAYELVPIQTNGTNGKGAGVTFKEPGFEPKLANAQKDTIGAVLTKYSENASELEEKLDKIIGELEKGIAEKTIADPNIQTATTTAASTSASTSPSDAKKKSSNSTR